MTNWSLDEELADRLRHAVVFATATVRALEDALKLHKQREEQQTDDDEHSTHGG
jgi:NTP pyrophosphatase (non-canonical NTP hydrolase)